jgi:hypothetical protein
MYRVSADIKYLDGTLAGLDLPHGYTVTMPTRKLAQRTAMFLERVRQSDDFIRACVTGNRYKVTGYITIERI